MPKKKKMSKYRYYFKKNDLERGCFPLSYWQKEALRQKTNFEIVGAKIEYGVGYFYCSKYNEVGETGDGCGVDCKGYLPRNKKNGRCRFSVNCYESINEERNCFSLKQWRLKKLWE